MAGVVYISEAEAARDFAAVMRHVRAGDEVVLRGYDGSAVGVVRPAEDGASFPDKTAEAVIARLRAWEARNGPLQMGEDFAKDVEEAHVRLNQPLDESKWD